MGDLSDFSKDNALRQRARQRIEEGLLPREKPTRIWGGRGTGSNCSLCDRPILESEAEMELEYGSDAPLSTIRFHLRCQSVWDLVRLSPPSQWISVEEGLPPLDEVVEARVTLGSARSIILSVMRVCEGEPGPVWLNATTNARLLENWTPTEWRHVPEASNPDALSHATRSA